VVLQIGLRLIAVQLLLNYFTIIAYLVAFHHIYSPDVNIVSVYPEAAHASRPTSVHAGTVLEDKRTPA
jgi:hypothetical protein